MSEDDHPDPSSVGGKVFDIEPLEIQKIYLLDALIFDCICHLYIYQPEILPI